MLPASVASGKDRRPTSHAGFNGRSGWVYAMLGPLALLPRRREALACQRNRLAYTCPNMESPMTSPASSASTFADDVYLTRLTPDGALAVSPALAELLVSARNHCTWRGTPGESQKHLHTLLADTARALATPKPVALQQLLARISKWDGGGKEAAIAAWRDDERAGAVAALVDLHAGVAVQQRLLELQALPGIGLVLATKVYRFVAPQTAAAAERHSTYFTNSLAVRNADGATEFASHFRREWASGARAASRWAAYGDKDVEVREYLERYLPLLKEIADAQNTEGLQYTCAARGVTYAWTPADVEMAMYSWWARHGLR